MENVKKIDQMVLLNNILGKNYVMLNKTLIKKIGLVEAAYISLLVDRRKLWMDKKKLKSHNSFFWTHEKINDALSITDEKRIKIQKKMVALGLIRIIRIGSPPTNYYVINDNKILRLLSEKEEDVVVAPKTKKANNIRKTPENQGFKTLENQGFIAPENQGFKALENQGGIKNILIQNPHSEGSSVFEKEEPKKVTKPSTPSTAAEVLETRPTIDSILSNWKANLPDKPSWNIRRSQFEDLFATLKKYNYREEDIPRSFERDVSKPWINFDSKDKNKNKMWAISQTEEDYRIARAVLTPVEIIQHVPTVKKTSIQNDSRSQPGMDIDTALQFLTDDDEIERVLKEMRSIENREEGDSDE